MAVFQMQGSGGLGVNVVAYSEFPPTARKNTIGIISETKVKGFVASPIAPVSPEVGYVWVKTITNEPAGKIKFAVDSIGRFMLYPASVSQWDGEDWVSVDFKWFDGSSWVDNIDSDIPLQFSDDSGFTYTSDDDSNWVATISKDGTLTVLEECTVDIFAIGGGGSGGASCATSKYNYTGGGGGGGGGRTELISEYVLQAGTYDVTIGIGGTATYNSSDVLEERSATSTILKKDSSAVIVANGGNNGYSKKDNSSGGGGGVGGSGGGGGGACSSKGAGSVGKGSENGTGGNGTAGGGSGAYSGGNGGVGINKSTRAFREDTGIIYSAGGNGGGGDWSGGIKIKDTMRYGFGGNGAKPRYQKSKNSGQSGFQGALLIRKHR